MRAWGLAAWFSMAVVLGAGCSNTAAVCSPTCGAAQTCCDDGRANACKNTFVDAMNCGACGNVCGSGQTCSLGACITAIDSGVHPDGGRDAAAAGNCHPSCAAGLMCCGTTCVSATGVATGDGRPDPSFLNCHVCGVTCDVNLATRCGLAHGSTSGSPQCLCGDAQACARPSICELVGGTYQCIDMTTDPRHCGDGGLACMLGEACVDGLCTCMAAGMRCMSDQACGTAGCIDLQTDEMNCGSVGNACSVGETCSGGTCHCGAAARCPGPPMLGFGCGQVCCDDACVFADDYNCGGCGLACAAPMACVRGLLGAMATPHCGGSGGAAIACDAPTDAAPSDGGTRPADADVDADVDAGIDDAGLDDADIDAADIDAADIDAAI